jgi:hypothetical protein
MQKLLACVIFCLLALPHSYAQRRPANGRSNENYVWIFHSTGKLERLFPLLTPVPEYRNHTVNFSVTDEVGNMYQINGIKEAWLKDTVIMTTAIQIVLIRKNQQGIWATTHKSSMTELSIICKGREAGQPISVGVVTRLVSKGKPSVKSEARLSGVLPTQQFTNLNH